MKVNDELIVDIKRLGINGEGIAYYKKLAIFVDGALPNEVCKIKIDEDHKNYNNASIVEIIEKSKDRIEPKCPHYKSCGACNLMHINYEAGLDLKRQLIIESLKKYTKINPYSFEIRNVLKTEQLSYRNRSLMPLMYFDDDKKIHTAMYKKNTNHLYKIDNCMIHSDTINRLNNEIIDILNKYKLPIYSNKNKNGILKYLSIRENEKNECMVTFITTKNYKLFNDIAKEIILLDNVKSVYLNINEKNNQGEVFGLNNILLAGDEYIYYTINNIKYILYPTTFFQLNKYQLQPMFDMILKSLKLSKKETLLDAYCGVGAISLYIAKMAKEVYGIENNPSSIESAIVNMKINNIKNIKFYTADVALQYKKLIDEGIKFDVVVLDPPRSGLDDNVIELLNETKPKKIIYVSCNHTTFAKNIDKLSKNYNINYINPIDIFANTSNVEVVSVLVKKTA